MSSGKATYNEHAHLYDIAFSWDIENEVDWLIERLGRDARRVLEPACGSGRMMPPFARRGIEIVGLETSSRMIELAINRMAALDLPAPKIHQLDMTRFELTEAFDGAICPINSLNYLLGRDQVVWHLESVARCLVGSARYMVQLDLLDTSVSVEYSANDCQTWEDERDGTRVRTTWSAISFDAGSGLQTESCKFEILAGPDAGRVYEERHELRKWNWEEWGALIAASPFRLAAVYDGHLTPLPLDRRVEDAHLTWHELVL